MKMDSFYSEPTNIWVQHLIDKSKELEMETGELIEMMQSFQNEPIQCYLRRKNRHRRKLSIQNGKFFTKSDTHIPLSNVLSGL
jgi:hypothetical protein